MVYKCGSRKFSPMMLILLLILLMYSFSLVKRLKRQQNRQNGQNEPNTNLLRFAQILKYFASIFQIKEKVVLYIITPTYPRPEQLPELTRLSQTLMVRYFLLFFNYFQFGTFCS